MRSQTLAVSLVLLLIAVATLPGLSFSLSSSVTSYNNSITINGGITIASGNGFHVTNVDESFKDKNIQDFDSAYEIASGDDSFCSKPGLEEVKLTIPGEKSFKICIKIDSWNVSSDNSEFDLTIDLTGDGNADIDATHLDGARLQLSSGTGTGYLYYGKNWLGQNQWQLIADANSAATITSSSEYITVDIKGYENSSVKIHFYIIFIQQT